MRVTAAIVLTCAALAAATRSGSDALIRRSNSQLELECQQASVFCCDALKDGDEDPSYDQPGRGDYYNCVVPETRDHVTGCSLNKECKRTPTCCEFSEIGGPIPNPQSCRDMLSVLKDNGHEEWLTCKEGNSTKSQ